MLNKVYEDTKKQHQVANDVLGSFTDDSGVIVYGQSGAGKTHSMTGDAWKRDGILSTFIKSLIDDEETEVSIRMIQIYKSKITDLLRSPLEKYNVLEPWWIGEMEGLKEVSLSKEMAAQDLKGAMKIINRGLDNRRMRDTFYNDVTSRSHLILFVRHNRDWKWFVDLAGMERVSRITREIKLYLEAVFINESLANFLRII